MSEVVNVDTFHGWIPTGKVNHIDVSRNVHLEWRVNSDWDSRSNSHYQGMALMRLAVIIGIRFRLQSVGKHNGNSGMALVDGLGTLLWTKVFEDASETAETIEVTGLEAYNGLEFRFFKTGKVVKYGYWARVSIGPKFINNDGVLTRGMMPDLLHLNEQGYIIWAESIKSSLSKLLGE